MEATQTKENEMRYQVIQFENGKFGVTDTDNSDDVAFGMEEKDAKEWADRLNLRHVWGI